MSEESKENQVSNEKREVVDKGGIGVKSGNRREVVDKGGIGVKSGN